MELSFLGAADTVTGSRTLVRHQGTCVLIDCGLFQGLKRLRLRNWAAPEPPPEQIDAIVLTHAHIDHSGLLPRMVALGYRGPVYCTELTLELARIMLPDAGRLQQEAAEYANRKGFSRHRPALPLYTEDDARRALSLLRPVRFEHAFAPAPGITCEMRRAGHLLGAASVRVATADRSVLFSGDLGRDDDLLNLPPAKPPAADAIVVESTYGDRVHPRGDLFRTLADVVNRTVERDGVLIVPAFAVGRAQTLMHCLQTLRDEGRIPEVPTYLNSPMAEDVTRIFLAHAGEHRLTEAQCRRMCAGTVFVRSIEESRRLNSRQGPMIIISASGMATGGRVLHHIRAFGPDPRNTILFVGFQAAGTRGATLVSGAGSVKIHGQFVPIRAQVVDLHALSAHADRADLLRWLGASPEAPRRVFVTHGEPAAADSLRAAIAQTLGWDAIVPEHRAVETL
jgi:metallo-beta-lactamase family protein